ncbi:MAG: YCF48-related protein [Acidobacteriota bacterium]|nr:YCF48-related protein [Acidobacteriota bacterium]
MAQWVEQSSGVKARLRAISAVSDKVAWASGAGGTCLKTIDGGATWQLMKVPGADSLDFRDVDAFDANTAYLLSIGEGEKSRIYKTTDGGSTWHLQFTNRNPKAFFDAMAFWDAKRGVAFSDPVDGRLVIIRTEDGGKTWTEVPAAGIPAAMPNEGGFAASGTCITVQGRNNVWIATGGGVARVYRSTNGGKTWQVAATPIISGGQATGNFSIAFKDPTHGVIVGGDYTKEAEARDNAAITSDGGRTWTLTKSLPGGFRSGVVYLKNGKMTAILVVGPKGTDYSLNDGTSWTSLGASGYHAVGFAGAVAWAVGEGGRIGKYVWSSGR